MTIVFLFIAKKVLEWSVVTAAVLTYVQIGPGGESLGSIVSSLIDTFLTVNWGELFSAIKGNMTELVNTVWRELHSSMFGENS